MSEAICLRRRYRSDIKMRICSFLLIDILARVLEVVSVGVDALYLYIPARHARHVHVLTLFFFRAREYLFTRPSARSLEFDLPRAICSAVHSVAALGAFIASTLMIWFHVLTVRSL